MVNEEFFNKLFTKIDNLQIKIESIARENIELHRVIKSIYKQLLAQSCKIEEYERRQAS